VPPASRRFADLLIAAAAHANGLDLYTRDGDAVFGLPSSSTS
jgi:predicted nucleic acid-binding protein